LQQQIICPFRIMQQVHMPPANVEHRFCTMAAVVLSSHLQKIFMPPSHFSILNVQRGTISQFVPIIGSAGAAVGMAVPWALIPVIPTPARSIVMVAIIKLLSSAVRKRRNHYSFTPSV
jgi:hypothetical protein